MENLQFDSGIKTYCINGSGTLRFHPGDPNLYQRFLEAVEKIQAVEQQLQEDLNGENVQLLQCMSTADGHIKQVLNWVFGPGNDFHQILEGVNLLAVADNGQRVITNLFEALEPVLTEGARTCARQQAQAAVRKAEQRRSQQ